MEVFWAFVLLVIVLNAFALWRSVTLKIRKNHDKKLLSTVTKLNRGTKSERDLVLKLLKYGVPAQTIFHDLLLEKADGTFSQIDVVVATTQGLIVFEVKDISGWIFGNGGHSFWTQVLAYGNSKHRLYNPIKQNNNHIKTLRKQLFQFKNIPFFSIILFYGDCELKDINFVPDGTFLVKPQRLFEVLEQIKMNNIAAPYTNKWEVIKLLERSVLKGDSQTYQEGHIENIKDMLGKDRIYD